MYKKQVTPKKYTIILYYYSMFSDKDNRGYVYISKQVFGSENQGICSTYILWPKNELSKLKSLRYTLRANTLKSSISPLFTPSKITILTPKIPSNPYKSILPSNSTKNHTQCTKFNLTNYQNQSQKITQNTSKINTFQSHKIHKQYHSGEVVFFYIKISYQKLHIKLFKLTHQ